ncbi:hypothetical protein Ddye_029401 [Dipteronia dyeriana]|uniref:HAT C-terminal dimerisation domain-containing protein n=1 Tax=Dipteronia dyeriana TaxID=168575 RepID=A0AAD9TFG3_9ROSI|nr:hypothetical protein Ddye_029401 [Dipteronia dyeriana]
MVCMKKRIPNEEARVQANLQVNLFKNKEDFFGYGRAKADWWSAYGNEVPELKDFAVKILSLTCSSSACERNLITFNLIHTKKMNRLSTKKLNSLVYIMYNKRLQHRYLKKKALKDDEDPLVREDMPLDDEWIVDNDVVGGTSMDVDMSEPSGYQQVGGKRKRNTKLQMMMMMRGDYPFDPHFKLLDTNDSLWDD